MEKPLSVLLVEDDPIECQEITNYIESQEGITLVGATNSAKEALEYAELSQPNAIILDLELHKGSGDGLTFLKMLQKSKLPYSVYILVTTNNVSQVTHASARKMGADFIMVKSQEDYSAKSVTDFLYSVKDIIQSSHKASNSSLFTETPLQKQQRIKNKIITELDQIGIAPNVLGRKYLIDCIDLLISNRDENVTGAVSEKYGKSIASIERAMQNAIERAWKTSCIEDLKKYYTARIHPARGVPTMTEFMYYYAEKIENNR